MPLRVHSTRAHSSIPILILLCASCAPPGPRAGAGESESETTEAPGHEAEPWAIAAQRAAAALGRDPASLRLLARNRVSLAFVAGSYERYQLRDIDGGGIVIVTVNLDTGGEVDEAELRRLDRERAPTEGTKFDHRLLILLLDEADHPALPVQIDLADPPKSPAANERERARKELAALGLDPPAPGGLRSIETRLSARVILELRDNPLVVRVSLAGDPNL